MLYMLNVNASCVEMIEWSCHSIYIAKTNDMCFIHACGQYVDSNKVYSNSIAGRHIAKVPKNLELSTVRRTKNKKTKCHDNRQKRVPSFQLAVDISSIV